MTPALQNETPVRPRARIHSATLDRLAHGFVAEERPRRAHLGAAA
jgi:hypothetical protein